MVFAGFFPDGKKIIAERMPQLEKLQLNRRRASLRAGDVERLILDFAGF